MLLWADARSKLQKCFKTLMTLCFTKTTLKVKPKGMRLQSRRTVMHVAVVIREGKSQTYPNNLRGLILVYNWTRCYLETLMEMRYKEMTAVKYLLKLITVDLR